MSSPTALFRNASTRPVELYLAQGVVVLQPSETIECDASEPMCAVLERRGILTRHEVPPAAPSASAAAPAPAEAPEGSRRRAAASTPSGTPSSPHPPGKPDERSTPNASSAQPRGRTPRPRNDRGPLGGEPE